MKFLNFLEKIKIRTSKAIRNIYFVEKTSRYAIKIFISLFFLANIIAFLFGNKNFIFFRNLISQLGISKYTPLPIIFNSACIITGILLIPFFFFLRYKGDEILKNSLDYLKNGRFFRLFNHFGFYSGLIGSTGFVGLGLFNMSWNPLYMHDISATLVLGGFIFLTFFISWLIIRYEIEIPAKLGIYGIVSSLFILISYLSLNVNVIFSFVYLEWLWMLIILSWLWLFIRYVFKDSSKLFSRNFVINKKKLIKTSFEFK
ncbi:MAG: hypothetical protein ACQERB_06745 [Promethearchaeati archaeon]